MNIAIMTELFAPSIGGQEIRYAELSRALVRRGHSVDIFCIGSYAGAVREEVRDDIRIHRYPEARGYQAPAVKELRRRPSPLLRYALWCRHIPADKYDFVLFNQWPLAHILLAPACLRAKAAIDWCEFREGGLFSVLQKYLPKLVSQNIANSEDLKAKLEISSGRRFAFVPSGIFTGQYKYKPRNVRHGILYLGRVTEHKNLLLLLSSFETLVANGYTGRLCVAGGGPALAELRACAAKSSVADKVDILGPVDESAKLELLANSEVLVITSRREGFPRVIAEAMASGLPVVTTDFPSNGAKEIVLQYGIGEVAAPDRRAISDAILRVRQKWDVYSAACLCASKSLDWEVLVDHFLQVAGYAQRQA